MTRWVRWADEPWHVEHAALPIAEAWLETGCGRLVERRRYRLTFSDFDPVEDECRLCRRALDGGKQ